MVTVNERAAFCWRSSEAPGFGFHCLLPELSVPRIFSLPTLNVQVMVTYWVSHWISKGYSSCRIKCQSLEIWCSVNKIKFMMVLKNVLQNVNICNKFIWYWPVEKIETQYFKKMPHSSSSAMAFNHSLPADLSYQWVVLK